MPNDIEEYPAVHKMHKACELALRGSVHNLCSWLIWDPKYVEQISMPQRHYCAARSESLPPSMKAKLHSGRQLNVLHFESYLPACRDLWEECKTLLFLHYISHANRPEEFPAIYRVPVLLSLKKHVSLP